MCLGFPGGLAVKTLPAVLESQETWGSIPGSGRSSGGGHGNPTPVFLFGESHGQRRLVGYSSWGLKESDTTERLQFHFQCPEKCEVKKVDF